MNDTKTTKSDTDVSESSSWIVLCECEELVKSDNGKYGDSTNCATKMFPDMVIVENNEVLEISSDSKSNEKIVSDTTGENQSQIVFDNLCDEKPKIKIQNRCKSKRKRRIKNNSNEIGTLFIIGTVLAITGASLLCLLTPKNVKLNPSTVSQLQTTCSKSGIVKDVSIPLKLNVNKNGRKLNIQDKDGSLQTYLSNQEFTFNTTNSLDVNKCFGPTTYQQFEQKIEAFNKQYANPSIPASRPKDQRETEKAVPIPLKSHETNIKTTKELNPLPNVTIPKKSSASDPSTDQTLLQYKIIFNVLQDLALLRLTQVFANQLADKVARRKRKIASKSQSKKNIVKKSEPLVKLKKLSSSSTAMRLWDELPFNNEISSTHATNHKSKEDALKNISSSRLSLIKAANNISREQLMEKHQKRQMDYLEKLKLEHKNRMAYLKDIRERQQKSIQALIQERQEDLKKLNHYTEQQQHIVEGKKRLLEINDYYTQLVSRSTSNTNHQVINRVGVKLQSPSITTISRKTSAAKVVNKNMLNLNSRECLNITEKCYDHFAKYWSKREEYLNEQINFMKEVSGSLKEVMHHYRNADVKNGNNKKCALTSIVNEASLVFPNLRNFKSEMYMFNSDSNSNFSDEFGRQKSNSQLDRYCSLHNFPKNRQCIFPPTSHNMNKDEDVFRKKGSLIRKKNLAIYHCKTSPKTIQKESSQHEMKSQHLGKKSKNI